MGNEYLIVHMATGELMEKSEEVTDRKQFLSTAWQQTFPGRLEPRAFQVGSGQDSRLVMAPLVCF